MASVPFRRIHSHLRARSVVAQVVPVTKKRTSSFVYQDRTTGAKYHDVWYRNERDLPRNRQIPRSRDST